MPTEVRVYQMRSITRYGGKVRAIVVELLKIHRPVEPSTIKMIVVRVVVERCHGRTGAVARAAVLYKAWTIIVVRSSHSPARAAAVAKVIPLINPPL